MTMPLPAGTAKLTYADFLRFPEDGQRHELLDGEHVVTPSPRTKHQVVSVNLTLLLATWARAADAGQLFVAPFDVVLSDSTVVEPDLLFLAREHLDRLTEENVRGAPDLVVEILSEGSRRRDEIVKRDLYDHFGVSEYWVVDPELETVKVYRREAAEGAEAADHYRRVAELAAEAGDTLSSPRLPGFSAAVAQLFV
ncbi:MAG: Uma2 family endonuclease [Holophagales bacterium]|nr:MAG: Uma2 family endonuclease [Holophagales bacterium]